MSERLPKTLVEAVRYFSDPEVCVQFFAKVRWPNGPICPSCRGTEHSYLKTRQVWKCKGCKRQFSVKVGTIFENSPIKMKNWMTAVWLIANSKNGISSHELGRAIGLQQKSAWFVLHRIRLAMRTGTFAKLDGEVETDETFVGGRAKNMHQADRKRRAAKPDQAYVNKTKVVGSLQRGDVSRVHAEVVMDIQWDSEQAHVRRTIEPGANLYTDSGTGYLPLRGEYKHEVVNHTLGEYARGRVTTNGIENFWALLKRGLHGTYVAIDPEHLFRYVDERVFTFNMRGLDDFGRFQTVLKNAADRRLTYAELTAA